MRSERSRSGVDGSRSGRIEWLSLPLAALVALAAGCGGGVTRVDPVSTTVTSEQAETPMAGEAIFRSHCVTCHGPRGRGGFGRRLKDGALRDRYADVGEVVAVITEGRQQMPPWGRILSRDEIARVALYVYGL